MLYTQIATTNAQIAAYTTLIADKQEVLNEAQANFDALNAQNKERIRAMEEEGTLSYWSVLFKANNFSDLLDRINMVEEIQASDRRRMEDLSAAAAELATAKAELEAEKANLEAEKVNLDAMQADLLIKSAEADALLDDLRATGDEFEAYMLDAEIRQYEVMLDIENLEAEYDEAVAAENAARFPEFVVGDTTPSSGGSQDGWVCPVPPGWYFSSPFGMRLHPIWGDYRMHYGIDMSMDYGTPIYAARDGTIAGCGWNDSMGWYIWMDHNDGFETVYMHMTNFIVGYGQEVSAGEVIGIELNQDAVRDAVRNAKVNEMKNIQFYQRDAGEFMVQMAEQGEKADVVFMDPPRAGSDEAFLSSVVKLSPKRIVYISCNPETQVRDLEFLKKKGYKAKGVWPFDMFPFCAHVECVTLLQRVK